jgi:hypothetical protein
LGIGECEDVGRGLPFGRLRAGFNTALVGLFLEVVPGAAIFFILFMLILGFSLCTALIFAYVARYAILFILKAWLHWCSPFGKLRAGSFGKLRAGRLDQLRAGSFVRLRIDPATYQCHHHSRRAAYPPDPRSPPLYTRNADVHDQRRPHIRRQPRSAGSGDPSGYHPRTNLS